MSIVAGYIILNSKWFEEDDDFHNSTFHIIYTDESKNIINHDGFRDAWIRAMRPVYGRRSRDLIHYFDTKSNYRRLHPFASAIQKWYSRVLYYIKNYYPNCRLKPPFLVLLHSSMRIEGYWRTFNDSKYWIEIYNKGVYYGYKYVKKIQRWYRRIRLHRLLMQEIENEIGYRPGKAGMLACEEHFYGLIRTQPEDGLR